MPEDLGTKTETETKAKVDHVLEDMASELHIVLLSLNLDPANPPNRSRPPVEKAWNEYLRRGGVRYTEPEALVDALITRVGQL